jgi:hypothetical protein
MNLIGTFVTKAYLHFKNQHEILDFFYTVYENFPGKFIFSLITFFNQRAILAKNGSK